jgi:hypothetical protein
VLTLAPLYALEGGAAIYPAFATGPFAWRVAPLLDPQNDARPLSRASSAPPSWTALLTSRAGAGDPDRRGG